MTALGDFREQLVQLLPRLRRFARSLARNAADADDLVQLSVERALLRWQQWQPGSRLDSWMFGIMKNAWIDELRSRQRQSQVFLPEGSGAEVGVRSDERHQDAMAIQQAMAQLPEEQRLTVALVLVEGLSYKEAAEVMEVPIGTLTSRLARAREALMRQLNDADPLQRGDDHDTH
jgi:RNA polymerase sigma-70 factor, ECF subfamily